MKRTFLAAIMVCIILALAGCGGGGSSAPPTIVADILSDPAFDGDIEQTSTSFLITQGMSPTVQSVFAGIDPATGNEFRAFLDFPLTGAGGVPGNAVIVSAVLDIFINSLNAPTAPIPVRIDLVSLQPNLTLSPADLNSTFLATLTTSVFRTDVNHHVAVDVTTLMDQAQLSGLANFQIRILVPPPSSGFIEINDTTVPADRGTLAPVLQVTFF